MKRIITILIFILIFTFIFWNLKNRKVSEKPNDTDTAVEVATIVNNDFQENQKDVVKDHHYFEDHFKSLPTIDDLKNLTEEEVHHTPEIIKDGGELVGNIYDEAQKDSSKRLDAMNFFKKCAEDDQVAIAIRAVCLKKVYKLIPEWEIPLSLSDLKISDEVLDLSMKLP